MQPTVVANYHCHTGENPLWHPDERAVYWCDIPPGRLFRLDPATGEHAQVYEAGEAIGGFTFQQEGGLLLFMARGAVRLWKEGRVTTLIDETPELRETRFNDVFADTEGRVFCGAMPWEGHASRLYRLDRDLRLTLLVDGVGTSNGMGFSPDRTLLYYSDSGDQREITVFDYQRKDGSLRNRRSFVKVTEPADGHPDGLAVDAEGCVWSARWDGAALVRYAPDGRELMRVEFPVRKVTSVAFGGPELTDMFVSSAADDDLEHNGADAGALFHLNLGIRGQEEYYSHIKS